MQNSAPILEGVGQGEIRVILTKDRLTFHELLLDLGSQEKSPLLYSACAALK